MDSIAMMTPPGQFYIRQKFNKVISVPEFVCVCVGVCVCVCVCVCIKEMDRKAEIEGMLLYIQ